MHVQYVRYKYFVGFSFNRYAYCMYNPLKYTDPTGERCFRWCETSYYIWQKAMQIVLQERLVVYNQAMASTWQLNQMIHAIYSSGSYAGGDTGGGSGYHGCPMGSGGPSGPSGNGQGDGGYSKEFINKCTELGITPGKPIPNDLHTNAFLKDFQEAFYPNAPMDDIYDFKVAGINKDDNFNKYPFGIGGRTRPEQVDGILTGCSNVYFNDDYVFNSPEHLYYTMGHELIHVSQIASLAGESYSLFLDTDFVSVIEFNASLWEHCWGNYKPLHYAPTNDAFMNYKYLYNKINYIYFDWTHYLIHP